MEVMETDSRVESSLRSATYAEAFLARNNDKEFVFSNCEKCFLMYQVKGGFIVSVGDPVGPKDAWPSAISNLLTIARIKRKRLILYKVNQSTSILSKHNFYLEKIGEDAIVDLNEFAISDSSMRGLRRKINQATKAGIEFKILCKKEVIDNYTQLKNISDTWLQSKKIKERGFSVGSMDIDYIVKQRIGMVCKNERILGFCTTNDLLCKNETSLDLMRVVNDAPIGSMHYLIYRMIESSKELGFLKFNMCLAPLSGLETETKTLFNHLMRMIYDKLNYKHGFKGLKIFKEYYSPNWSPRFVATKQKIDVYLGVIRLFNAVRDCK
jgi:phosphatidylglycerol lysyltransferase